MKTYNFGVQPGGICTPNNGVEEIVWVALALILQFMEEVEEVERKCRRRSFDCRRKPADTDELDIFGNGNTATTVTDDEAVNAR